MEDMVDVLLDVPPGALRSAIEALLSHDGGIALLSITQAGLADVVVGTTGQCPPARCAEFAQSGARVIVLVTFPNHAEEVAYQHAGAARYLPMGRESLDLVDVIRSVADGPAPALAPPAAPVFRPAATG